MSEDFQMEYLRDHSTLASYLDWKNESPSTFLLLLCEQGVVLMVDK
jgi:hypothetical protein